MDIAACQLFIIDKRSRSL